MVYLNTEDPIIIPLTEGIAAFKALESSNHSMIVISTLLPFFLSSQSYHFHKAVCALLHL